MRHERLMIFGASTRAAAQSAVRARLRPLCADHFSDEDLFELAEVLPLTHYPHGLIAAAGSGPPLPWMYTGAIENHPRLLEKLAAIRPLWGNPADVVTRVRDPFAVARVLKDAGLDALRVCPQGQPPPRDGRWLVKPLRGAGGRGIQVWDNSAALSAGGPRCPYYFQRRAFGEPHSAIYLATPDRTVFIGISRQLVGEPRLNAGEFAYCGSVGPVNIGESVREQVVRCGEVVASEFGLRGLFGIDFVVEDESIAWLTEVNPRYTASVEIFETALGISFLGDHVLASAAFEEADCSRNIADDLQGRLDGARRSGAARICGKAIVYAPFTVRAPSLVEVMRIPAFADNATRIADRPRPGTIVPARAPLCTLLVDDWKWSSKSPEMLLGGFEPALSALEAHLEPDCER